MDFFNCPFENNSGTESLEFLTFPNDILWSNMLSALPTETSGQYCQHVSDFPKADP